MAEKTEDQARQDEPRQDEAKATRGRQAKQDDGHLIAMIMGGETIKVHPSCVADHKRLGWGEA